MPGLHFILLLPSFLLQTYLWQRLSSRSIWNWLSVWSGFHPQAPFTAAQYLYILCMNLLLYNLCSQFKSTRKSLNEAEHSVYSELCYGTLSSISNEIIWVAMEKGRKHRGSLVKQTHAFLSWHHACQVCSLKKKTEQNKTNKKQSPNKKKQANFNTTSVRI